MITITCHEAITTCHEASLCFLSALNFLNVEPEKLTDDDINLLLDHWRDNFGLETLLPAPIHTNYTHQMHHQLFHTICLVMNPRDLQNVTEVKLFNVTATKAFVTTSVAFEFERASKKYRFQFKCTYKADFKLTIKFFRDFPQPKEIVVKKVTPLLPKRRLSPLSEYIAALPPGAAASSLEEESIASPLSPLSAYSAALNLPPYKITEPKHWNLSVIPSVTRQLWREHALKGTIPGSLKTLEKTYLSACEHINENYPLLQQLCRMHEPTPNVIKQFFATLRWQFQQKNIAFFQ